MITPDMLQQTPGMWYIDARLFNSTWVPGLTLRISSFMSKCLFWDEKNETWSTDGCQAGFHSGREVLAFVMFYKQQWFATAVFLLYSQVGEKSKPEQTQCLCNHLTLFGSSFFVMPNHVDISRTAELFATVSQNFVVLALLCAFFGLYLITLLWACYADRRSSSKVRLCWRWNKIWHNQAWGLNQQSLITGYKHNQISQTTSQKNDKKDSCEL